jgi:hypothetical protein
MFVYITDRNELSFIGMRFDCFEVLVRYTATTDQGKPYSSIRDRTVRGLHEGCYLDASMTHSSARPRNPWATASVRS